MEIMSFKIDKILWFLYRQFGSQVVILMFSKTFLTLTIGRFKGILRVSKSVLF